MLLIAEPHLGHPSPGAVAVGAATLLVEGIEVVFELVDKPAYSAAGLYVVFGVDAKEVAPFAKRDC